MLHRWLRSLVDHISAVKTLKIVVMLYLAAFLAYLIYNPGKGWGDFMADWSVFVCFVGVGVAFLPWIATEMSAAGREEEALRRQQKERIRVIPCFSPKDGPSLLAPLKGTKSIYETIIDMLERANDRIDDKMISDKEKQCQICILACSLAFDYPGRETTYENWGKEFSNKLSSMADEDSVTIAATFLSDKPIGGYRPLSGFLEVLASYCAGRSNGDFSCIRKHLQDSSKTILVGLRSKFVGPRFRMSEMESIPFQIMLVAFRDHKEVVVTFAGTEILEAEWAGEPQGIHSSDPYVVETFQEVYREYTSEHRRRPFPPTHTLDVIARHESGHIIRNYLGLGITVAVSKGVFSPAHANSSKFTAWVLTKILSPTDRVLDIGSGTGVLAMVAAKTIGIPEQVTAVECVSKAYEDLKENRDKNCPTMNLVQGALAAVTKSTGTKLPHDVKDGEHIIDGLLVGVQPTGVLSMAQTGGKVQEYPLADFDVVVADLPFVDAHSEGDHPLAFYDMDHRAHQALLAGLANGKWMKKGGRLVTAFSTLGGLRDVHKFESMIYNAGNSGDVPDNEWTPKLAVAQKFCFFEAGYAWMVCVIMQTGEGGFDDTTYWWDALHARITEKLPDNQL